MSSRHTIRRRRVLATSAVVAVAGLGLAGCAPAPAVKVSFSVEPVVDDRPDGGGSADGSSADGTSAGDIEVTVTEDSVVFGDDAADTRLVFYQDLACPHCRSMHDLVADDLREWARGGDVAIEIVTVDFLSQGSRSFSTQAANLLATVAEQAPASWLDVQDALYDVQGDDLDDDGYLELAREAGADLSDEAEQDFRDQADDGFVDAGRATAGAEGVSSVPWFVVDGVLVDADTYDETRDALVDAVEASVESG